MLLCMSDKEDDQLSEDEIARRMERGIRRFLKTPPQPHGKNPKSPAPARRKRDRSIGKERSESDES
jgi:hypothetical protein